MENFMFPSAENAFKVLDGITYNKEYKKEDLITNQLASRGASSDIEEARLVLLNDDISPENQKEIHRLSQSLKALGRWCLAHAKDFKNGENIFCLITIIAVHLDLYSQKTKGAVPA
jgi:hypothetical protein